MSPVTEIATLFLKPGTNVEDPSSPAYAIAQEAFSTISNQSGFQRAYWGRELEDESIVQLFIDWDTIDLHKDFTHSPIYASFSSTLSSLVARAPLLYHFYPTPFPPAVLGSAPVVEIVTFYNTEEHFVKNVERFIESCAPDMKGCVGHAFGGVVEEIEKAEGEGKGKAVVLCVGWESKEAHMEFRETETFKENVHLLREGMGGAEMHHVAFKPL